ncbi:tRNA (guanine-N(7)-)-methyltransferase [Rosistilla oblonga]|uniref:tRNA (guanine-N(7)-)-methyltransferase n=1 Tax=Rosistilla oblonga TaxID=2527990 RepID=A0A518IYB7_9BACT|nr:tRNA (guanosine(46)-N7)-methyltransferase TrmB [Rosistilla oblonga]QDV13730.1 tRNA (guanine-N(7)-)-methyltransferase [Rosistilla oblonga]QDV58082.1 tRNA (guanine-N(7)-)-methyltransferase [Rosistilla oblonga]
MPRQQLRTPSTSIDLSQHFRMVDALPQQVTSQTLFQNDAGLQIEVGSGKGLFLLNASGEQPDQNFLGIEIAHKYAKHAATKLKNAGRTNAIMASGDALPIFEKQIPDASLAAVHVYFPDPWWKKKHKKRRVLNEPFLRSASRTLAPGGRFYFWTDVLDYFESTLELMAMVVPELGPPLPDVVSEAEHDLDYRTHFERRSRKNEIPVYRVHFDKPA